MRSDVVTPKIYQDPKWHVDSTDRPAQYVNTSIQLPHYVVIVYGMEITESVLSISYTHSTESDPTSATIEINSNLDQWILTPRNLGIEVVSSDSRAEENTDFVTYGLSDEVPSQQTFNKPGISEFSMPPFQGKINPTGGAVDHKLGVQDAYNNSLFLDAKGNLDESFLKDYKSGKILLKRLNKRDQSGTELTDKPLPLQGRFRLDPFSSMFDINMDNWYDMFNRAIKQPELFRYSEFKKMLIYLVKLNALVAYNNEDATGFQAQLQKYKDKVAEIEKINADKIANPTIIPGRKPVHEEHNIDLTVKVPFGSTIIKTVTKLGVIQKTTDSSGVNKTEELSAPPTPQTVESLVNPDDLSKIIITNGAVDQNASLNLSTNLQQAMSLLNQGFNTNGDNFKGSGSALTSTDPIVRLRVDVEETKPTTSTKTEVLSKTQDVKKLPGYTVDMVTSITQKLTKSFGGISRIDYEDPDFGWEIYKSNDGTFSLSVIRDVNKSIGVTNQNLDLFRIAFTDTTSSSTAFKVGSIEFQTKTFNALNAIKDVLTRTLTGNFNVIQTLDGKPLEGATSTQIDKIEGISPQQRNLIKQSIVDSFSFMYIYGYTDEDAEGERPIHQKDQYHISQFPNANLLALPYNLDEPHFKFEHGDFDSSSAGYVPHTLSKIAGTNTQLGIKPGLESGAGFVAPPSPFSRFINCSIQGGQLVLEKETEDTQEIDFGHMTSFVDVRVSDSGDITITLQPPEKPLLDIGETTPIYRFLDVVVIGENQLLIKDLAPLISISNNQMVIHARHTTDSRNSVLSKLGAGKSITDLLQNFGLNRSLFTNGFGFFVVKHNVIKKGITSSINGFSGIDHGDFKDSDIEDLISSDGLNKRLHVTYNCYMWPPISDGIVIMGNKAIHKSKNEKDLLFKYTDGGYGVGMPTDVSSDDAAKLLACIPDLRFNEIALSTGGQQMTIDDMDTNNREWVLNKIKGLDFGKSYRAEKDINTIVKKIFVYRMLRTPLLMVQTGLFKDPFGINVDGPGFSMAVSRHGEQLFPVSGTAGFLFDKRSSVNMGTTLDNFSIPIVFSHNYNTALSNLRANEVRNLFVFANYKQSEKRASNNVVGGDDVVFGSNGSNYSKLKIDGSATLRSLDEYAIDPVAASTEKALKLTSLPYRIRAGDGKSAGISGAHGQFQLLTGHLKDDKSVNRRIEIIFGLASNLTALKDSQLVTSKESTQEIRTTELQKTYTGVYSYTFTKIFDDPGVPDRIIKRELDKIPPPPSRDVILTHLYQLRPGDPIFNNMDPVRIFERSKYPQRYVDEDKNTFDDYVYFHAFSGVVESVQKTTGTNGERKLVLNCKDMKQLLHNSQVSTKPAVVNERNLETNLFGITPFQTNAALDSVRKVCEKLIQAKGSVNSHADSAGPTPLNTDIAQLETQEAIINAKIGGTEKRLDTIQNGVTSVRSGVEFLNLMKIQLPLFYNDMLETFGIIFRVYDATVVNPQLNGLNIGNGFTDNVNNIPILTTTSSLTNGFLNLNFLPLVKEGTFKNPSLGDFEKVFKAGFSDVAQYTNLFIGANSIVLSDNPANYRLVAFLNVDTNNPPLATLLKSIIEALNKYQSEKTKHVSVPQNKAAIDANDSQIVIGDDHSRYINENDQYIETRDLATTQRTYSDAFQKCISKARNRIFPYSVNPGGVGNYGVRVITIIGSMNSDKTPNLMNTAKQFQAGYELSEIHPRYRNPQVIRDTFAVLSNLFATKLSDFAQFNGLVDGATGLRQTISNLLQQATRVDNFVMPSLGERMLNSISGLSTETDAQTLKELDSFVTGKTTSNYIKSTLIDILIKSEIENGYLYIVEPEGFVSSTFHPYNPKVDTFSNFERDIRSRLEILNEVTSKVGFYLYATPKGDYVLQPPLFPFNANHFSIASDEHGLTGLDATNTRLGAALYNHQYFADTMHLKSIDWQDDSSHIVNAIEVRGGIPWLGIIENGINPIRAVLLRSDLIARYGLRVEIIEDEIIYNQQAASAYAYIKMQEINRNARTMSLNGIGCPSMMVGRPLAVPRDFCMGYIKRMSVSWNASSGRSMNIELVDVRPITISPNGLSSIKVLSDYDRIDLLNYQDFWANRVSGRGIQALAEGKGTDFIDSFAGNFASQQVQERLSVSATVNLDDVNPITNFDLSRQLALQVVDKDNEVKLRKVLGITARNPKQ